MTSTTTDEWVDRARHVADELARDAAQRDQENRSPRPQIELLRESGLLTLLGPDASGGGGGDWATALRVTRAVTSGDGSVGQLLGYHYLWACMPHLWGTAEQRDRWSADSAANKWFWAGAVNPRDADVTVVDQGDHLEFSGHKSFSTGARAADHLVLEGVILDDSGNPTERRAFGLVAADTPGLQFNDDWDNVGMRLTESGSVDITKVAVPWSDALGYTDGVQEVPIQAALTTLIHQLVFANLYLGLSQGALRAATAYTRSTTRPWLNAVGITSAEEDPYLLHTYGELTTAVMATEALVDRAVDELDAAYQKPETITERSRGELMVLIAAAKAQATRAGLEVCSRIFEVTGARATARTAGLDRFWRDLRTHTLHDPVAYKLREIGNFTLNDRIPEPGWYS
jgi:alkylation response protein AidB-like acyl-CoA dehydrogenase